MEIISVKNQKGFTLIELVIVIILIGILAATALPKFANLTSQARVAANQGVAGGLSAAMSIAHAAWIANGQVSPITLEGTSVIVNTNGWPSAGVSVGDTPTAANCVTIWNAVLNNPPTAQTAACTANTSCYTATGPSADTCLYTYAQGTGTSITYTLSTGAVTFVSGT